VKKLLLIVVLLGVVLVGGAYWLKRPRTVAVSEEIFTYTPVEYGDLRETVSATGVLKPRDVLLITSELPGTVVQVLAKVNELVKDGQPVLKLDDSLLSLKVREAQNAVEQAQEQQRVADLDLQTKKELEHGGGFRSEREQAEAKARAANVLVKAAQLKEQQARDALEKTSIQVPVLPGSKPGQRSYIVLDSKVERGQMVGPTLPHPLFTLAADLSTMEVHAQVAEQDIGKVRKGMSATFTVSAYTEPDDKFSGRVREVRPLPTSQQGPVLYDTVIDEVANKRDRQTGEWQLRPGMMAAVSLIRRELMTAWKMPKAALGFQMEDAYQSDAARTFLAQWQTRADHADWRPVWTWDSQRGEPWPIFVRISKDGIPGLSDDQFNEVIAWEPGHEPSPSGPPLRVIINAPPPHRPGLFEQPTNIKF
jgi:HlyD family secretion protein